MNGCRNAALILALASCGGADVALSEQTINVNLLPMNQQAPQSMGPTGRVERVLNGIVRKFLPGASGNKLSIEQRPGSTSLSTTTFANGSAVAAPANPKYLDTWSDQLLIIGGTTPYARSEARDRWERVSTVYAAAPSVALQKLTKRPLYNSGAIAYAPDAAAVGNVLCNIAMDSVLGARVTLVDANGVQIRAPFAPTGTVRAKVVSDGARFWVYSQAAGLTDTTIQVFDTDGAQLATSTIAWGVARDRWDVGVRLSLARPFLVTPTGATLTVSFSSYAGGVITTTTFTPAIDASLGVARIENTQGGTNIYVACANAASDVTAYEITGLGAINHTYAVAAAAAVGVNNITGFVSNGSFDIVLAISVLRDNTATPSKAALNNFTLIVTVTYAGGVGSATQRSLAVVSRAYVDALGTWRVVAFYQSTACSIVAGSIHDVSALGAQPTFFVLDLSESVPGVVGQFDTGFAYAYYATSRNSAVFYPWHLSSVAVDAAGVDHIPLGYLGTQTLISGGGFVSLTGIDDVQISAPVGRGVATTDGLLIPGLQADFFDGTAVAEWGLQLAPEIVTTIPSGGGSMTPNETVVYVVVAEWPDSLGNLHQSALSATASQGLGPTDTKVTLTIACDRTTTKPNITFGVYRTFSPTLTGTTPGVILRRVGSVANNLFADTVSFVDTVSDASAAVGQSCYSQPLDISAPVALDFFPFPAFSKAIVCDARMFVIGYDKAIWFSFEKVEGQGLATNPLFRIVLPTQAEPIDIVALDTRLVIFCDDGTEWTADMGNLPNATLTLGAIPKVLQVPATVGTTASALLIPEGAIHAADSGVWIMDRSIQQKFIGGPVLDEVNALTQVTGIAVDKNQRVYFTLATSGAPIATVLVFDLIAACWYVWTLPAAPVAMTTWKGEIAFAAASGVVRVMDPEVASSFTDDGAAIDYHINISSMGFGGPSGWQRLWGETIFGQWKGPHLLSVAFTYDNAPSASETFTMPVGVDPSTYRFQVRQTQQKNIAVEIDLASSFTWPTLATIQSAPLAGVMLVDDVSKFVVGNRYVSITGGTIDGGQFDVVAVNPAARSVSYTSVGGWAPVAAHTVTYETSSLTPGNSFTVESVQLRIGTKPGLGRQPTNRRVAP